MKKEKDKLVKDPVCGMVKPISEMKEKTVYKGKTYYFCWKGDKDMFLAHPKHWATKKGIS